MSWRGLDAAKTVLASGSGRSVFRLTSPSIGLQGCPSTAKNAYGSTYEVSESENPDRCIPPELLGEVDLSESSFRYRTARRHRNRHH
jgi:hypothetical protein